MIRERSFTEPIGERVAALESEIWAHAAKLAKHEDAVKDHDKWLNQVRGSLRTLAVLWAISTTLLGLRVLSDFFPRSARASTPQSYQTTP
jgi:hypothetical protein